MRVLVGMLAVLLPALGQDARQLLLRSIDAAAENSRKTRQYTFVQRVEERQLDDRGGVKKRESSTFDVTLLAGSPYQRLIARNDKPLPPDEERKQQQALQRSIAERTRETPEQRDRRRAEWEQKQKKQLDELRDLVRAFDWKMAGEETVAGHAAYILAATPRPGYRSRGGITRIFPKIKGRLWLDKTTAEWLRFEAEAVDTISVGWVFARVHKGTRMSAEQMRVNDEVWLPRHASINVSARLALIKRVHSDFDVTFRDYKKFSAESRIVDMRVVGQ